MLMNMPPDRYVRPDLPDIDIRRLRDLQPREPLVQRLRRAATILTISAFAILVIALTIFVPVLFSEISRIDAFVTATGAETAAVFVDRMTGLFIGALVVAIAIVCFGLSFMFAPFEPRFLDTLDYADLKRHEERRQTPRVAHLEGRDGHVRTL